MRVFLLLYLGSKVKGCDGSGERRGEDRRRDPNVLLRLGPRRPLAATAPLHSVYSDIPTHVDSDY